MDIDPAEQLRITNYAKIKHLGPRETHRLELETSLIHKLTSYALSHGYFLVKLSTSGYLLQGGGSNVQGSDPPDHSQSRPPVRKIYDKVRLVKQMIKKTDHDKLQKCKFEWKLTSAVIKEIADEPSYRLQEGIQDILEKKVSISIYDVSEEAVEFQKDPEEDVKFQKVPGRAFSMIPLLLLSFIESIFKDVFLTFSGDASIYKELDDLLDEGSEILKSMAFLPSVEFDLEHVPEVLGFLPTCEEDFLRLLQGHFPDRLLCGAKHVRILGPNFINICLCPQCRIREVFVSRIYFTILRGLHLIPQDRQKKLTLFGERIAQFYKSYTIKLNWRLLQIEIDEMNHSPILDYSYGKGREEVSRKNQTTKIMTQYKNALKDNGPFRKALVGIYYAKGYNKDFDLKDFLNKITNSIHRENSNSPQSQDWLKKYINLEFIEITDVATKDSMKSFLQGTFDIFIQYYYDANKKTLPKDQARELLRYPNPVKSRAPQGDQAGKKRVSAKDPKCL